jgi:suppressor of G2 allele of SKP1
MDHAQRGTKALSASDFRTAIQEYTRALIVNPHAPDYYIKRSTAFSRLKPADGGPDFTSALHDAEMAVALGIQRARREHIVAGQMRRGIVLYQQGRIGDAAFVFEYVRGKVGPPPSRQSPQDAMNASMGEEKKASKEASISQELQIWEMKVKARLAKTAPGEDVMKVTVKELPDIKVPGQEELKKLYQAQLKAMTGSADGLAAKPTVAVDANKSQNEVYTSTTAAPVTKADTSMPVSPPPAPSKVRHEWYQSSDTVTLTLYAKGVPKDKADIEINEQSVCIYTPMQTCMTSVGLR